MRYGLSKRQITVVLGAAAVALACALPRPLVLYNRLPSVPIGWYVYGGRDVRHGDVVAFELPPSVRGYARRRGTGVDPIILKRVAAVEGDLVRVSGRTVYVNGRFFGPVLAADSAGRPLPQWHGDRRLREGEVFVLSEKRRSFDSRYFGPLRVSDLLGAYRPLRTTSAPARRGQSILLSHGDWQHGCQFQAQQDKRGSCASAQLLLLD